ncbi:Calcium-binding component of the spindle pole body (SPB) half-bridge [Coemansia thaxteri]|uniref:Calcium-binding component of the spindle pole body (SPB) half-bridge n=1 Tax=Coemansia thaxteri TaxID=2663907 RepID=A0A9W8EJI9_9FUNG|nr:Calcium-binding component of the spindle pole body (SPB) half-bridge [Coemansia thaxteri]KAJ2008873.1 Calcium-binding component of the spindle pole body (SPB) half-bridge [Coemansia thaxteri]KAJ2473444.1 Calcium-binding component of the spindle pole body (SPB) half-bridge [Coemansia sp. RSA 2322]KAJ2483580.1 Calcium-binding component of the spindle pole body (SPB) half-bridge [Coemansia sp. RSA 2320]
MNAYHPYSSAQRSAPARPAAKVSEDMLEEIQEAFTLFDTNKDGYIDYFELKVAMRALGFDLKKDEVLKIITRHGSDDQSKMSLEGFTAVMSDMISKRDPVEEYRKAFKLIDENGTGGITVANLRRIARELGENIADEEIQAMIEEFDLDNDGSINEEEFIRIMVNGH